MAEPGLYGIQQSNRKGKDLWGKNQFNSTFPAALACYMRDKKIRAVYLKLDDQQRVVADEISIDQVFNVAASNKKATNFQFEAKYEPYQKYSFDDIRNIDLVIKEANLFRRALEIKLTVIPDSATFQDAERDWGAELVVRPATTSYCALGMASSCEECFGELRDIFEPLCRDINHWDNIVEISSLQDEIIKALNRFQHSFYKKQQPFLLQPVWKTKGKSPFLDDNAFDLFVWSDFALCRPFIERSKSKSKTVNRYLRSSARLVRILYELASSQKASIGKIYTEMAFGHQSDKEFALNGKVTRGYMNSPRRSKPSLPPEILKEIILNGGEENLSPERRFDQTIYYTAGKLFDKL